MKKKFFFCVLLLSLSSGCAFTAKITPDEISIGIGIDAAALDEAATLYE